MADAEDVFRIARSLEGTIEAPHFDRIAFKVVRTYATLASDRRSINLKFTPERGRVGVRLTRRERRLLVGVFDTGMGISQEDLEKLFQRFFRTSEATRRAIQGTGLGLTITKAIVEAHGGSIEVESELGVGTTFVVDLPLEPALSSAHEPVPIEQTGDRP